MQARRKKVEEVQKGDVRGKRCFDGAGLLFGVDLDQSEKEVSARGEVIVRNDSVKGARTIAAFGAGTVCLARAAARTEGKTGDCGREL